MANSDVFHLEAWFSGRVQGVGFRFTTVQIAREFEVSGTVKNLMDGRVHLVAQGTQEEVRAFLGELRREMEDYIRETETRESRGPRSLSGFRIL